VRLLARMHRACAVRAEDDLRLRARLELPCQRKNESKGERLHLHTHARTHAGKGRAPETVQMEGYGCYACFENKRSLAPSLVVSKLNTISRSSLVSCGSQVRLLIAAFTDDACTLSTHA
jgi:hypothetical protein